MFKRAIYLDENITTCSARKFVQKMDEFEEENKEQTVVVFIDSFGGCVASMLAIIDRMQRAPFPVATVVVGRAMSAGATIAVHGTKGKRFALAGAQYMFHQVNGYAIVSHDGMKRMKWCNDLALKMIADAVELSVVEFEELVNRDYFEFSEKLLTHKGSFLDGILGSDAEAFL